MLAANTDFTFSAKSFVFVTQAQRTIAQQTVVVATLGTAIPAHRGGARGTLAHTRLACSVSAGWLGFGTAVAQRVRAEPLSYRQSLGVYAARMT